MNNVNSGQLNCKIRTRDALVGLIASLFFYTAIQLTGQHQILVTLASINFGFVAALASAYLWSPLVVRHDPALIEAKSLK